MISVTEQKRFEEISELLAPYKKVYLIGCGSCATQLHTGGRAEVVEMKQKLEAAGKEVTGWMVIPTACDELTGEAIAESAREIGQADALLVLTCAYGVQTVASCVTKPAIPALNTLFIGKEMGPDTFVDVCAQCGECVIGETGGICPVARCAKGLFNGPCGGSVGGKCEVSPDVPCAWQEIYDRLAALGELHRLEKVLPPKNWRPSQAGGPRRLVVKEKTAEKEKVVRG